MEEIPGLRRAVADGDDGACGSLLALYVYILAPGTRGAARRERCRGSTASCSTNGISTNSTTSFSCVPPSGSAACSGRAATARIIDGLGPDGVAARVVDVTGRSCKLQTGYIYHYAFAMLIGVAALITWYLVGGAH